MRVSVVVPTYRRPDLLGRCLDALNAQTLEGAQYEVIVADDAASDATRQQVEELAGRTRMSVRYVAVTGSHGPAAARNAGWRQAHGPIIAFTDDDCIPDPGWLESALDAFANADVQAVTGRVLVPLPDRPTDYERDAAGLERAEFVTANCFCRREVLQAVGGFDERFVAAWREDSDLHFALLERGARIVKAAKAIVVHPVRPAPWAASLRQQRKILFDALLYRKHPELYRQRIRRRPRWDYYLVVAALGLAVGALAAGWPLVAASAATGWVAWTAAFCLRRLRGTAWTPQHVAEMLVTSALIPPLAVFWRCCGAARFRVLFL